MKRRAFARWVLVGMLAPVMSCPVVLAPSLAHAAATKPELPKLTVGTVFPMTGAQAAFGREAMRGIELARDLLLEKNPDLAGRLSVATGDALSTAKEAAAAAEKLAADRAHVLIGSLTAASSGAVAAVGKHLQLPTVTPLATPSGVPVGSPVFRAAFDEAQGAALLAKFALEVLGAKQAGTLRDDTLTAAAFTEAFAAAFTAGGGQIVAQETYDLASDDFTAPLKRLETAGAKFVATPASYQTAGSLMMQARKLNTKITFLGDETWDTQALLTAAGAGAGGHYYVAHFAEDDTDKTTQAFVAAFRAKYGRAPGVIAASAFDAMNLVAHAFEQGNSNMRAPLAQALGRTRELPGATGVLSFTDKGETRIGGVVKVTSAKGAKFKTRVTPPLGPTTTATLPGPKAIP